MTLGNSHLTLRPDEKSGHLSRVSRDETPLPDQAKSHAGRGRNTEYKTATSPSVLRPDSYRDLSPRPR
jgi:hypothetical protein